MKLYIYLIKERLSKSWDRQMKQKIYGREDHGDGDCTDVAMSQGTEGGGGKD